MNTTTDYTPIRIRQDLYEWLQVQAKADNRSTKMYLEVLLVSLQAEGKRK